MSNDPEKMTELLTELLARLSNVGKPKPKGN